MILRHLWLQGWRNYARAEVSLDPGFTLLVGANGQGKTNLVEAVGYLATLDSFRHAPTEALVGTAADAAVVRGAIDHDGRDVLIEAEVQRGTGRSRVQVNRQRLARARDLLGVLRVTVFHPDDLELVKGGPSERRSFLDDVLASLHPRHDRARADVERILRQRTALLKQAGGRLGADIAVSLDVWDARLAEAGTALGDARADLVEALAPRVALAYAGIAGAEAPVRLAYRAPWRAEGLAAALAAVRGEEVRRGVSLVGPHRDDVAVELNGLPARTHASQGEQRCLALGLRLGAHGVVTERTGGPPVLALDDVFSELDRARSRALLAHLPPAQIVMTTAGDVPAGARPDRVLQIEAGTVRP